MPDGSIGITKERITDFLQDGKGKTKAKIQRRLTASRNVLMQLEEFVPWPALIDSFRADVRELQALLDRVKADA